MLLFTMRIKFQVFRIRQRVSHTLYFPIKHNNEALLDTALVAFSFLRAVDFTLSKCLLPESKYALGVNEHRGVPGLCPGDSAGSWPFLEHRSVSS